MEVGIGGNTIEPDLVAPAKRRESHELWLEPSPEVTTLDLQRTSPGSRTLSGVMSETTASSGLLYNGPTDPRPPRAGQPPVLDAACTKEFLSDHTQPRKLKAEQSNRIGKKAGRSRTDHP